MKRIFLSGLICSLPFLSSSQDCLINWDNKVPITIDNSAGDALTNYEIELTIDTETPIASAITIFSIINPD